ncbi:OmpA family protein [Flavobacterium succinicans]|uniref:OmpA family protein n=1 Tax=Flavobacterium succinicans TaxID=29536 RepID=UPI0018D2FD5A|nr:OmpA family protein [Flavobacterium succinicans]
MLKKADKLYDNFGYFNAITIYEKVADKGFTSVELLQRLGNAYYFNGLYNESHKWYKLLFDFKKQLDPIYYYRYSQSLKNVGDYDNAEKYFRMFEEVASTNALIEKPREFNALLEESKKPVIASYTISNLESNSASSDFGGVFFGGNFLFTSTRAFGKTKRAIDPWTSDFFSTIFKLKMAVPDGVNDISLFSEELRSPYHVATPVFTQDGLTMYFTASSTYFDRETNRLTKAGTPVVLKIYKASFKNGKWKDVVKLPFNNDRYNTAHPVLSPDEKSLYFVSDNPAGFGGNDIYKVDILGAKSYGVPQNLGPMINTVGKETFPFISSQNKLYFASDGHIGLGGLDVFVTDSKDGKFSNPVQNVGQPINSSSDDFCFIEKDSVSGFFSSNRAGGKGKDDIYKYEKSLQTDNSYTIEGTIVDQETKEPINDLKVKVYNRDHELIETLALDKQRQYSIKVDGDKNRLFYLEFTAPNHETIEIMVNVDQDKSNTEAVTMLKKDRLLVEGNDLSKLLVQPITFGFDNYSISTESKVELQKVIEMMYQFPNTKVLIRTHTDSRHSFAYNMELSRKRAKAVIDYLIKFGVSKGRLTYEAFGEYQLLNHCADGVKCSEKEHKINRRCEFIVQ